MIEYTNKLDIRNAANLPACKGAKYLLCIRGEGEALIAKAWGRKEPKAGPNEVVVVFGGK